MTIWRKRTFSHSDIIAKRALIEATSDDEWWSLLSFTGVLHCKEGSEGYEIGPFNIGKWELDFNEFNPLDVNSIPTVNYREYVFKYSTEEDNDKIVVESKYLNDGDILLIYGEKFYVQSHQAVSFKIQEEDFTDKVTHMYFNTFDLDDKNFDVHILSLNESGGEDE